MPSKAHKYFNKFNAWTRHASSILAEIPRAQEEFFIHPNKIREKFQAEALKLFHDWFLLDRKLTYCNRTPLDVFILENAKRLKPKESATYRAFAENNQFGIFRVERFKTGEWMDLKSVADGETHRVIEEQGSLDIAEGSHFIARLLPFDNHWALLTFVLRLPDEWDQILNEEFQHLGEKLKKESLRPRQVLTFFMPNIDWMQEGLPRVKARLAFLLDQWKINISVSAIETRLAKAQKEPQGRMPDFQDVLKLLPSYSDLEEFQKLITSFWNLSLSAHSPAADKRALRKGPVEMRLIQNLMWQVQRRLPIEDFIDADKAQAISRQVFAEWIDVPRKDLDGKTPRQAILEERAALGNPEQEIGYDIQVSAVKSDDREEQGFQLAAKAQQFLRGGRPKEALDHYMRAYYLLRGYPELFKIFGGIATAWTQLGEREKSIEALLMALKENPDYSTARNNLHLLESMSIEEFQKRFKSGFFKKVKMVDNVEQ